MLEPRQTTFTISITGVLKVVLVLLGFWFVYLIRDVLVVALVALFLAALIDPFADWFQKRHIPRSIAVLVIYVLLFGLLALLAALLVPALADQIPVLVRNLNSVWERVIPNLLHAREFALSRGWSSGGLEQSLGFSSENSDWVLTGALSTIRGAIGFVFGFIIMLVMAFYMVVEEDALKTFFRKAAPASVHSYLSEMLTRVQGKIGHWLRGQLLLSAIVGSFVFIGLSIIGITSAVPLAVLAGFAEFVPYIGPVFAAIPAVALATAESPVKGLIAVAVYVVIQQLENNLLVPKIMQRAIGLNPIVSIISLLIGARIGGVVGAVLAIPVATAIAVFVTDYLEIQRARERT